MNRSARAAVLGAVSALSGFAAASAAPQPNPLVLIAAGTQQDDVNAMASVRRELRSHGTVDVITFDVEAPAIVRAARDSRHPEWLTPSLADADRVAVARALGATIFVAVTRGDRDRPQIRIYRTSGSNQPQQLSGSSKDDAAAIEDAAVRIPPSTPAAVVLVPAVTTPAPAPAPSTVVAPPVAHPAAPPAIAPPMTVLPPAPVPAAPGPVTAEAPPIVPKAPVTIAPAPPVIAPAAPPVTRPAVPVAAAPVPPTVTPAVPAVTPPIITPAVRPATPVVAAPVTMVPAAPVAAAPSPLPAAVAPAAPTRKLPTVVAALPAAPRPAPPAAVAPPAPRKDAGNSPDNPIVVTNSPGGANVPGDDRQSDRDQLQAIAPFIAKGDQALDRAEVAEAISYYRQAVDGAPTLATPRLKLAKAYQQGGFEDKALDEAKRALMVAPNSVEVQEFLIQLDAANSTAQGTVTLYEALIAKSPQDPTAHLGLGDALWNAGLLDRSEAEYKTALKLSPAGDTKAPVQLIRLYAAQARYGDVLATLKTLGPSSYVVAARVIHNRLDTLISMMASGREAFDAGKSSHEVFYDTAKTVAAQSAALADFVDKVKPPAENKVSHLSLSLAASLIAQEAEVLRTFIETSDSDQEEHAVQLEKAAQSQILTAHAEEEKAGLFGSKDQTREP